MKSKTSVALGFGLLVAVTVAFFWPKPEPEPTPFEMGYGLRFVGEKVSWNAYGRFVRRSFVSEDPLSVVASRIERALQATQSTAGDGLRIYSAPGGAVTLTERFRLPSDSSAQAAGAKCVLETTSFSTPSFLQRVALAVGIRP